MNKHIDKLRRGMVKVHKIWLLGPPHAITSPSFDFYTGDFNVPKINWSCALLSTMDSSSNTIGLTDFCADFNFSQLITQPTCTTPTCTNYILDLVPSMVPDLVHSLIFLQGLSNHSFIQFELKGTNRPRRPDSKYIRDYSKAYFVLKVYSVIRLIKHLSFPFCINITRPCLMCFVLLKK